MPFAAIYLLDPDEPRAIKAMTTRPGRGPRAAVGPGLPIVALTGWSPDEDRRRSRQLAFTDHLVKPAEPAHLDRLLAALPLAPPLR